MHGVLRIPTPPPPPPTFDYIIDIYSGKIVVTDAQGNTVATFTRFGDLNDWLKNIKGKKIKINTHVTVSGDLVLTSNEYWIFGEWIDANVRVVEPNITIVSFAPLGNAWLFRYVMNREPVTYDFVDVSGLKIFAVYADLAIETRGAFTVDKFSAYILSSLYTSIDNVKGDIYVVGNYVRITNSVLRTAYVYAHNWLYMDNVKGLGYGSVWCIVSPRETIFKDVVLNDVNNVYICARKTITATLNANTWNAYDLLKVTDTWNQRTIQYTVEAFGQWRSATRSTTTGSLKLDANEPPPPGVTYSIDLDSQAVIITNNTSETQNVMLTYRLEVYS